MRVVGESLILTAPGPYGQQDVFVDEVNTSAEADVLAMIEGNGTHGIIIADMARLAVARAAEVNYSQRPEEAVYLPDGVGEKLGIVTERLRRSKGAADYSGAAVTAVVISDELIKCVYLGDLLAYYLPKDDHAVRLLNPHNRLNKDERHRAVDDGGVIRTVRTNEGTGTYWYDIKDRKLEWGLDTLRSVGHFAAPFVLQDPQISKAYQPDRPGQLVIVSPGVIPLGRMDRVVERKIRDGTLTQAEVESMATKNKYDASIIIAQIG